MITSQTNKKLAILVNGEYKVMGNFSRGYIDDLPYKNVVLFGGLIPIFKNGTPKWKQKLIRYWIAFLAFNNPKKIEKLKIKRLTNILKKEKVNIALCEYLNTAASVLPACKKANIPMISNVLGYEINIKERVEKFREKYQSLAQYQSHTIPVAKEMIPKLVALGFDRDKITYSPIGPTKDFFEIKPNYESLQFLAIGRFAETKAPHLTIKAFNEVLHQYPDAKLVFAGDGEMMTDCVNLVKQLNIEDNVNFIGWINKEQQKILLSESFAFIQHSVTAQNGDKEGTPVAILEASAAGLPIVSTFHAGIPDTVIHEKTGYLVQERDWKKMGQHMISLLKNRELAKTMGYHGRCFCRDNFSMEHHLNIVNDIIKNIIKK